MLGDIEALSPRLWLEALRQGVPSAKLVAWVSDGGRGFWRLFRERFEKTATGILDFYHAAQHLWATAVAWLDAAQSQTWFEQARHQLRHGESAAIFQELAAALELKDLPAGAREALRNLYNYLDKHRAHIDYARFKELGLPLGSGMVESACKWLIQQRFKGVNEWDALERRGLQSFAASPAGLGQQCQRIRRVVPARSLPQLLNAPVAVA